MSEFKIVSIEFSKLGGPVFVGRDRGAKVREKFNLDVVDTSVTKVNVVVPEDTYSINPSFFLALFGASIRKLGSAEKFFEKYEISAPDHIMDSIKNTVSRALLEKKMLVDK